jgi:glycosyl transferase family 2
VGRNVWSFALVVAIIKCADIPQPSDRETWFEINTRRLSHSFNIKLNPFSFRVSVVKVSIVIPLYNKSPYVKRALDSIKAQTFADFEVLVVDDGSTDDGASIVEGYADPRVRLLTQSNAGPGQARNTGVAAARAELIAFLDADDEWLPTYLEESVNSLESLGPEVAAVTSGYLEFPLGHSKKKMWQKRGITEGTFCLSPETSPSLAVSMLAYMTPPSTLVRTEVIRKWGGFYSSGKCLFAEDAHLWLKVLLNETVGFNLEPLVKIHREASALSKNLQRARPVEPFLIAPHEIEAACPSPLRNVLRSILAIRAAKTACVLGYWGQWREARSIMERFTTMKDWQLPYYAPALVCSSPVGAVLGKTWRRVNEIFNSPE